MSRLKTSAPRGSIFSEVKAIKTPQSRFNLSYVNKLTCNMGELIPFYLEDVVPGDKFDIRCGIFGRLQPMVAPMMQDLDIEVRYFYVPYRILWDNFEDFMIGKGDHVFPYWREMSDSVRPPLRISDLFGVDVADKLSDQSTYQHKYKYAINVMPYRAYMLIYKEFFVDENYEKYADLDARFETVRAKDGFNSVSDLIEIQKVSWRKDYFTSALPWTQRGNMAEVIGEVFLKDNVRLRQNIVMAQDHGTLPDSADFRQSDSARLAGVSLEDGSEDYFAAGYIDSHGARVNVAANLDPNGTLGVNIPISQLRMANAVQRFLERSAISGNRFSEYILGMFGVKCADSRLQRPEYLGGGRMPFTITPVMQMEQAQLDSDGEPYDNSTPQGNLAAVGSIRSSFGINKPMFFPEYGLVMGLLYVRPKASYIGGFRRYMNVGVVDVTTAATPIPYINDRMEQFYNPFFANLGEDAVLKTELKADIEQVQNYGDFRAQIGNSTDVIFGYQSRYAYMKYRPDEVHGDFKTSLKHWTLAREFGDEPELGDAFIQCNPSSRIWAVEDDSTDKILLEIANVVDAVRPMPKYGTPTL